MGTEGWAAPSNEEKLVTYKFATLACLYCRELLIAGANPSRPQTLILRKYKGKLPLKVARDYEETRIDFPIQGDGH